MSETLVRIETNGFIGTLFLENHAAFNALSPQFIDQISDAWQQLETNSSLRVVRVVSTHAKAFIAGADIKAMQAMTPLARSQFGRQGHDLMRQIETSRLVSIAEINGFCLGGGFEFALSCDVLCAGPGAQFGFPEVGLGLIPGFGGTQRFARSVGMHRALGYVLSAQRFGLDEAQKLGFLYLTSDTADALTEATQKLAQQVAQNAPLALEIGKRLVRQSTYVDLDTGIELEIGAFGTIGASQDVDEGLNAFTEKRAAEFKGK